MSSSSSITRTRCVVIPLSYRAGAAFSTRVAEGRGMARILIHEPHPDVRVLFAAVVRRAGHDPVGQGELTSDDAPELMILEPASADGLAAAARLRRRLEDLPIICASIEPPSLATQARGHEPPEPRYQGARPGGVSPQAVPARRSRGGHRLGARRVSL